MCFGAAKEVTLLSALLSSEEFISFLFFYEFISIKARQDHLCQMVKTKSVQEQLFFFNAEQEIISKIGLPWNLLSLFSEVSVSMKRGVFPQNLLSLPFFLASRYNC